MTTIIHWMRLDLREFLTHHTADHDNTGAPAPTTARALAFRETA
jgi:hypothetical protein